MRLTWPLVGRAKEMRLIEAAISDPDVAGVVICGPAGVGKSRIAREALDGAASRGCEVRWVVGTSCGRGIPLGALASWAGLAGGDSLQLVCSVIDSLTAASSGSPVLVGVDDAHLLDDLSMFVLDQFVQRGVAKVVLTVRDDQPIPIPIAIQELWKLGEFDRVELQSLSADETTALLSATLEGSVDPQTAGSLWQMTHGNILYLRHIVEQAVADGHLEKQNGYWQWVGDPVVPHGLVELIESRMGALPDAVSAVVDALAIGEPIELPILRRITDADAVEEADIRGLIRLDDLDERIEVRLAHPLYGEVRRRRAAPTRLRRLRGLLAAELADADDREDVRVLVRRGALSLDSDLEPDAELLIRAAQGAIALADLVLADRLAGAAVRAGGGPEASFLRAHAMSWLGRGRDAEELLGGVAVAELSDEERARFTYLRASNLLWALADPVRAKEVIDEGAAAVAEGPARRTIDAVSAVYWFAMDKPDAAIAAAKSLVLERVAADRGRGDGVGVGVDPWGCGTDDGSCGRGRGGICDCDPMLGCAAYEVQHRGLPCERAGAGGTDQRGGRGGGVGAGPGGGLAGNGALVGAGDCGPGGAGSWAVGGGVPAVGTGGGSVERDGTCAGLGVSVRHPAGDGAGDARSMAGSGGGAREARDGAAAVQEAGLREEHREGVGGCGAGRGQRGDRHLEVGGRNSRGEWSIRGGSGVSADGDAVGRSVMRGEAE